MKKCFAFLAFVGLALSTVWAKDVEQVSVVENEIATITVPFAIQRYSPSNKEVVRIEEVSETMLRITALKKGRCDLDVRGDKGLTQKYEISVLGNLASVLETLSTELEPVPEVRAQISGDFIRLDGEVSSIKNWEYLSRVLESYNGLVKNFATFYPGPEILQKMKETLQQGGFNVVFEQLASDKKKWKADQVALALNKQTRIMTVQSKVYTPERSQQLMDCLRMEKWLALPSNIQKKDDSTKMSDADSRYAIRAMVDVALEKPSIRLGVAYMVIGESEAEKLGSSDVPVVHSVFSTLQDLVRGGGNKSTATIGASLDSTMMFLAQNGVSRTSEKAYTMLTSWDEKGAKFKSGGVLNVRVSGTNNGDLKEIPYGFDVQVTGGLVSSNALSLDMKIEISSVMPLSNDDIDKKEDRTEQRLTCRLGKTTMLGGFSQLVDQNIPASGLPYIRHAPLLKWFVSESSGAITDRRLIIMICPELTDGTTDSAIDVDKEINLPVMENGEKTTEERVEEKKRFHGFWSWLNVFTF